MVLLSIFFFRLFNYLWGMGVTFWSLWSEAGGSTYNDVKKLDAWKTIPGPHITVDSLAP